MQSLKVKFSGLEYTGDQIFDFTTDFCMGVARRSANALPVMAAGVDSGH